MPPSRSWVYYLATAVTALAMTTNAGVIYVSPTGADQSPCGSTQQTACASLGYAITAMSSASLDVIEVAAGEYTETIAEIEFSTSGIAHDLTIRAAASAASPPTIDRAYNGRLFTFAIGAGKISVTGLRFYRGGWATVSGIADMAGSLMRFVSSDGNEAISFTDCVFEATRNPVKGYAGRGAVASIAAGSPTFTRCQFKSNWGGIASAAYINGLASPLFEDCVFQDSGCFNDGWGGAVVPEGASAAVWRRCVFRNNTCDYGGAVDDGGTATPVFDHCSFHGNHGRGLGGAYYGFGDTRSSFTDCDFVGNRVPKGGNGQDFYLSSSVHATFDGCVFDAGEAPIVVADGASGNVKDNSTLTMRRSVVKGYRASQGALLVSIESRATVESTTFQDNACTRGGAVYVERPVVFTNCSFLRNVATEGGAILMTARSPVEIALHGSLFEGNTAKNGGGAIKATGPLTVTVTGSVFTKNEALGVGGGAIFASADTALTVNASEFTGNRASVGGAVYADGVLAVVGTSFTQNALRGSDEGGDAESCGLAAGTGGAVYAALPPMVFEDAGDDDCAVTLPKHLRLERNRFSGNSAGNGGGGALFVDKGVPSCVRERSQLCIDCVFAANAAAYGADVATIAYALTLASPLPSDWELMTPVDVVVGAVDHLGQPLAGAHAAMAVRVALSRQDNSSSAVTLNSNASRVLRGGAATFKGLALALPVTALNNINVPLTLTFSSDRSALGGGSAWMTLTSSVTLLKCPGDKGLIRASDGKCLVEATGDSNKLVAAIVFSLVLGGGFAFGIYWSYKHSSRVLETLHRLVTGVGASMLRLAFELLDVISDVQAMVNLFLYDVTLTNIVFAKAAYVTLFAISLPPSVAVMKATLENVVFQWKRLHARRVAVHNHNGASNRSEIGDDGDVVTELKQVAPTTTGKEDSSTVRSVVEERSLVGELEATPVVPIATRFSVSMRWDVFAVQDHLNRQIATLQRDLEYHQARSKYMQRVLVRLFTEDILLFVFNLYIYLANQSDTVFLQSHFRKSLEFSILMSAMHFGAQVQNIVTWLHANKVGEVKRQLETLHALRRR